MRLIKPDFVIQRISFDPLKRLEEYGRVCYKSEDKITPESAEKFVKKIVANGHETILEHAFVTVKFIVDRGVTHELVRHRVASYSQESTRWCNFHSVVALILPPWVTIPEGFYPFIYSAEGFGYPEADLLWYRQMKRAEDTYTELLDKGWSPQQARSVLPNSLKTEIVMTANLREWRHVMKLRAVGTTGKPHPQMLEVMVPLLENLKNSIPIIFDDINV